jgi:hypothetical protein
MALTLRSGPWPLNMRHTFTTRCPSSMGSVRQISSLDLLSLVIACWIFTFGDVPFTCWIQSFSRVRSCPAGNLDLDKEFLWVLALNMPERSRLSSTAKPAVLPLNFMWYLMIFFLRFLQLRGRTTLPVIGRNFAWKIQLTFSLKIHRPTFKMTGLLTKNVKTSIARIIGSSPFALPNHNVINLDVIHLTSPSPNRCSK